MKPTRCLPALALLGLITTAAAQVEKSAPPAAEPAEKVVVMDAFKVQGNAVGNFAITVQVFIDKDTDRMKLIISKVAPGSDAERLGLMPSDEIVKIGGLTVADMEPEVGRDSPLGKLLLNRNSGDILDLEVVSHRPRAVKLRASSWTGVILNRPEPKVAPPAPETPAELTPKN